MRNSGVLPYRSEVMPLPKLRRMGALSDRIAALVIKGSAFLAIVSLILIFIFIGKEALPVLTSSEVQKEASLSKLFLPQPTQSGEAAEFNWQPISEVPKYSLLPLFVGTLKVTIIAVLIAIPLAVAAALYTSEFAPPWARETIKPCIEILAGIPSVVVGFFCLMVIASWLQGAFGWTYRLNALTAGIGLSLAVIPIVYTVSEDAFSSVPQALPRRLDRNGSLLVADGLARRAPGCDARGAGCLCPRIRACNRRDDDRADGIRQCAGAFLVAG